MRKLLTLLLLIVFIPSFGQMDKSPYYKDGALELRYDDRVFRVPVIDNSVVFSKVVNLEGNTAQAIYDKAKMAVVDLFRSAKDVTQLDDPTNKIIVAKGGDMWLKDSEGFLFTQGGLIYFTLKIECRDDRYKVSVYGFRSYNSVRYAYGVMELSVYEADALKQGIKKGGVIKSNIYGLSWLAWFETANSSIERIDGLIEKATQNTSDDW